VHKLKLYLDTTIFNFAFSDKSPEERDLTLKFFKNIDRFEVSISNVVLEEVGRCAMPKRAQLMELINRHDLNVLELDQESAKLAQRYIKERMIPVKYENDAFHIAIASVNDIDAILSWNFEHIVKVKTKREVVGINLIMGYRRLDIYTPREVVDYV
jgi:predicted nucleic acid-binding protein